MRWMAGCSVVVVFAACGAEPAPTIPAAPAAPRQADALRLVKPPLVTYSPEWGSLDVWVRLNRPMRHNLGHPGESADFGASLEAAGGEHDIPGLYRNHLRPTCYGEDLYVPRENAPLADGQTIEVTLVLGKDERLTAPATVRVLPKGESSDPVRELRCPSYQPGTPRARRCPGNVDGRHLTIGSVSAAGTSCRTARAVLRSVGRWADSRRCYDDLCAPKHRVNRGYRCEAALSGEAAWDILCRRGRAEVRGFTAD